MLKHRLVFITLFLFTSLVNADSWQQGFNAYQQQNYEEAIQLWQQYLSNNTLDTDRRILTYSLLGDAKLASNQLLAARAYLDNPEITQLANQTDNEAIQAHFFNNRANMWMLLLSESKDHRIVKNYYHQAIADYDIAFYATLYSDNQAMLVNILSNEIQAHLKTKEKLLALEALLGKLLSRILRPFKQEVENNIQNALPELLIARDHVLFSLDDANQNKPFLMLSLGQLALRHYRMQPELPIVVLRIAELLFKYTIKLAYLAGEKDIHYDAAYIQSYANGLLGQICEYYIQTPEQTQNAYHVCSHNLITGQTLARQAACQYCTGNKQACLDSQQGILFCSHDERANKLAAYEVGLLQTRTAISYALQNVDTYTPSLLYLWYWHTGRMLQNKAKLLCQTDEAQCTRHLYDALLAYQNAVQVLQPIQSELITEQRNSQEALNERIKPVYFGLAELLLQHGEHNPEQRQMLLESAIQSIESIKKTELQEYFQSNCLLDESDDVLYNLLTDLMQYDTKPKKKLRKLATDLHQKRHKLVIPDPNAALLYPIIFDNQISLLLRLANGDIHHVEQTKSGIADKIKEQVYRLRKNLEEESRTYKREAKSLYQLLISPINGLLRQYQVETLLVVPDELLRTIPFSAFLNPETQQFLVQEVALVTIPSYDSIGSNKHPIQYFSVLLNGLSKQVDNNFPPLENVVAEVEHIETLFDYPTVLLNQNFTLDSFANTMRQRPYSVIHIASHGQFKADPTETFLLTYDGRLKIDGLETILKSNQKQGYAVGLLTLSACQTAAGDDRAALGIAGVAIKSGAQSALASLWSVKDDATSILMQAFYQQLTQMSKAKAFQQAQNQLIEAGHHPNHWSAFLLIGNWL